jgi:serine/threonine protein kinase
MRESDGLPGSGDGGSEDDGSPDAARRARKSEPREPEELFLAALELPADARAEFVRTECGDRPAAARQVLELLREADAARTFFDSLGQELGSLRERIGDAAGSSPGSFPDASAVLSAGARVGPYEIVEKIGEGGMGTVFRARDPRLGRDVALKFLPRHLAADQVATERFRVEARAAAALDHPNVCTIHEIGETSDGRPYLALAFYRGETLKQRLERSPLPLAEAIAVATAVARALGAAHARGIVHRDVKPGNVMLTDDGRIKLLDFGLARVAAEVTLTPAGLLRGTVAYMAPEQVRGDEIGPRTDLWALGVLLYETLAGQLPFRGNGYRAVFRAILEDEPRPLREHRPEVPAYLVEAVGRLLQKNPARRCSSAGELLVMLTGSVRWRRSRRWIARLLAGRSTLFRTGAVLTLLGASVAGIPTVTDREGAAPESPIAKGLLQERSQLVLAHFANPAANSSLAAAVTWRIAPPPASRRT